MKSSVGEVESYSLVCGLAALPHFIHLISFNQVTAVVHLLLLPPQIAIIMMIIISFSCGALFLNFCFVFAGRWARVLRSR